MAPNLSMTVTAEDKFSSVLTNARNHLNRLDRDTKLATLRGELSTTAQVAQRFGREVGEAVRLTGVGVALSSAGFVASLAAMTKAMSDFSVGAIREKFRSIELNVPVQQLTRFERAFKSVGNSNDEAASKTQNLVKSLQDLRAIGSRSELYQKLESASFDASGRRFALELYRRMAPGGSAAIEDTLKFVGRSVEAWSKMGDKGAAAIRAIEQAMGPGVVDLARMKWDQIRESVDKNEEAAEKFQLAWSRLGDALDNVKRHAGNALLAPLTKLLNSVDKWIQEGNLETLAKSFEDWINSFDKKDFDKIVDGFTAVETVVKATGSFVKNVTTAIKTDVRDIQGVIDGLKYLIDKYGELRATLEKWGLVSPTGALIPAPPPIGQQYQRGGVDESGFAQAFGGGAFNFGGRNPGPVGPQGVGRGPPTGSTQSGHAAARGALARSIVGGELNASGLFNPISSSRLGGGLGGDSASRGRGGHQGDDIMAPYGSPVYAAGSGKVEHYGVDNFGQMTMRIRHDDGSSSSYLHLSKRSAPVGSRVEGGQVIGESGTANGVPHLHFERRNALGHLISPRDEAGWTSKSILQGPGKEIWGKVSTFDDKTVAPGGSSTVPGIALRQGIKPGQMFDVTDPASGKTIRVPQTDWGPNAKTGRDIDVNRQLAEQFGYNQKNFPTDKVWKVVPVDEVAQARIGLDQSLAATMGVSGLMGTARLDVNVRAPRGTSVDADGGSIFQPVRVNRAPQAPSTGGGMDEYSNYSRE